MALPGPDQSEPGPGEPGPAEPRQGGGKLPAVRIGDVDRNAAVTALSEHLGLGRLNLEEFNERSTVVANARTMDEVDAVFGDLPEPRPVGAALALAGTPGVALAGPSGVAGSSQTLSPVAGPNKTLIALIAAMPFLALGLFFITGLWYFFLLVPLSGAVLGPFINKGR
ncbi:DUF1707 domain-containing protein [Nakamurella antarctica]|uniref:DUF1707 domain-containing protein n=1 Tax=Nakamurella antarctica TaxID=1902245 RepID=A0A3G8ZMH8_9ACTN|nr:DUF1707 domain-containing protein [Nakamurella antarctica]AZI58552.1 DUF1707 domain-containing protein [Nakamurella antarctica]